MFMQNSDSSFYIQHVSKEKITRIINMLNSKKVLVISSEISSMTTLKHKNFLMKIFNET